MSEEDALRPFELGDAGSDLRRRLVDAVLQGEKTATSSLRIEYEPHTGDPMPRAGERYALLDADNARCGVVETTEVRVLRAGDVDLQFAIDEGERFATVADWRTAHDRFWVGHGVIDALDDDTLVVCERFRWVEGRAT